MFVDRSTIYRHSGVCEDIEPDYCTILRKGRYTIKLFHTAYGIGMSDKYDYDTSIEIFEDDNICTRTIAKMILNKSVPITSEKDINNIIQWIYANA